MWWKTSLDLDALCLFLLLGSLLLFRWCWTDSRKTKRGKFYKKKIQHSKLKPALLLALSDGQKCGQIPNILIFQSVHTHNSSSSLIQKALTREIYDRMWQNFGNKIFKCMCRGHYLLFSQVTQNLSQKYLN